MTPGDNKGQHQEPEENEQQQQSSMQQDNFSNPLDSPVTEKAYTRPNVRASEHQINSAIPEPRIDLESIDLSKPSAPPPQPEQQQQPRPEPQQPFNPQMGTLKKKDQRAAAERAVDTILDAYAWLKSSANNLIMISDKKIKTLQTNGKIDLSIPIPYDEHGNLITIAEYIKLFNEQNADTLVFEPQAREEIKPLMVQYFEEQGIGMTNRDELIYVGIKELLTFGIGIWQGLRNQKDMIKALTEITAEMRAVRNPGPQYAAPPPPPGPDVTMQPSSTPPPPPEPPTDPDLVDRNVLSEAIIVGDHNQQQEQVIIPEPSLGMMGADAALKITGAEQPGQQQTGVINSKKRGPGAPSGPRNRTVGGGDKK